MPIFCIGILNFKWFRVLSFCGPCRTCYEVLLSKLDSFNGFSPIIRNRLETRIKSTINTNSEAQKCETINFKNHEQKSLLKVIFKETAAVFLNKQPNNHIFTTIAVKKDIAAKVKKQLIVILFKKKCLKCIFTIDILFIQVSLRKRNAMKKGPLHIFLPIQLWHYLQLARQLHCFLLQIIRTREERIKRSWEKYNFTLEF